MIEIVEFFKGFDFHQILSTFVIVYIFTNAKYKKLNIKIDTLKDEFKISNRYLYNIDQRLNRLEGRFEERGYWESRNKKIGEE